MNDHLPFISLFSEASDIPTQKPGHLEEQQLTQPQHKVELTKGKSPGFSTVLPEGRDMPIVLKIVTLYWISIYNF